MLLDTNDNGHIEMEEWISRYSSVDRLLSKHSSSGSMTPQSSPSSTTSLDLDVKHPKNWAISWDQLQGLDRTARSVFGSKYESITMRDISTKILMPLCAEAGTSYALAHNPKGRMLTHFVTHAWGELFAEFVRSLESAFAHELTKPDLWICALALVQSADPAVISAQVGSSNLPLNQCPFVKALQHAQGFVVVRNSVVDLYDRLWCVCELVFALKAGLVPQKTRIAGSNEFSSGTSSCLVAECWSREDKQKILQYIVDSSSYAEVDTQIQTIRGYFSKA